MSLTPHEARPPAGPALGEQRIEGEAASPPAAGPRAGWLGAGVPS